MGNPGMGLEFSKIGFGSFSYTVGVGDADVPCCQVHDGKCKLKAQRYAHRILIKQRIY